MIGIRGIAKKPIVDATASPEDVISGRVFYNNSGRQRGTMSSDLCFKQMGLTIPKGKYRSYTEQKAYSLSSDVGSSDNVYLPNGINIVRNCARQDNGYGYTYQKISDYHTDINVDLMNVSYFIINGVRYAFASEMTENIYYGHNFMQQTRYYFFENFLLYMDQGILKSIYAGTEYMDYGELEEDISLYIIYHN